ncbi:MAG: hypothetical protein AB7O92_21580 [Acidimicrobiia bacterium]
MVEMDQPGPISLGEVEIDDGAIRLVVRVDSVFQLQASQCRRAG